MQCYSWYIHSVDDSTYFVFTQKFSLLVLVYSAVTHTQMQKWHRNCSLSKF